MTNITPHKGTPTLYSIPPAAPFLSTLVDALVNGDLIKGFKPGSDALALSSATIYVPTRRAARALQAEFVARIDQNALLLPRILPLGDIDEDQFFFEKQDDLALELDPTIGSLERQLLLTRMIHQWADTLGQTAKNLFGDEAIAVPASITDAAWLANDLADLMDHVSTEEADWTALETLVPDEHADWWKLTLEFLKIATGSWPVILRERGATDVAARRSALLRRQAEQYQEFGSAGPVIAAGSTGSIPATAALLGTIAHMQNGAVVLPGLDRDMSDQVWQSLNTNSVGKKSPLVRTSHEQAAAPGHPQYGLKKLLDNMGVQRGEVKHIGGIDDTSIGYARLRETIVNLSMEPSENSDNWPKIREKFTEEQSATAFSDVALIEAEAERQEALAIAFVMREVLNHQSKRASLVTPDRVLARRVSAELKRFGIEIDDSAGIPLSETTHGSFVRLVLAATLEPADPVTLLSLIKHPLASFGLSASELSHAGMVFELGIMRGNISIPDPGKYRASVEAIAKNIKQGGAYLSSFKKQVTDNDWAKALFLADAMDTSLSPLFNLQAQRSTIPLGDIVKSTIETLEAVAKNDSTETGELYKGQTGGAIAKFFEDLILRSANSDTNLDVNATEWPSLFKALLGSRPVRLQRQTHSRLSILGPLEARLQQDDCVILGGLNEGSWPATTRNDPFLNRPMKASLLLDPPERRIGLAAHDFQMLLGAKEVVLSRTKRAENAPTVPSRWLQRLLTLAGENASSTMRKSGKKFVDWALQIDRREPSTISGSFINSRPEPKPPISMRPRRIRVTEVETWIRDPYAIYAKYILGLEPLEPIRRQIDARERGVLYHAIFEDFSRNKQQAQNDGALELVIELGKRHFRALKLPDDVFAMWWPRFADIADEFVRWESTRRDQVADSFIEVSATVEVGNAGFTISGKADRVDLLKGGGYSIIDYKTGMNPSVGQANSLLAPQLPLEGAMALKGAFREFTADQINELLYVRLRPSGGFKVEPLGKAKDKPDVRQLSEDAWSALEGLVGSYANIEKGYISRARPFKQGDVSGDYDHLARVMEWSVGPGEEDIS